MGRIPYDRERCARAHIMHYGSGLPVFKGQFRQYGRGLGSMLAGVARTVLPIIAPVVKSFAKKALKTSGHILSDVISGQDNLKSSARKRISQAITDQVTKKRKRDIFN